MPCLPWNPEIACAPDILLRRCLGVGANNNREVDYPTLRPDVRTGTRSGRIKSSLATSPALDTAADTPAGIAGHVMPWCSDRHSTPIARHWKGLRPCGSPPTQAEGGDLDNLRSVPILCE